MEKKMKESDHEKTTSEKPVSLKPLSFKDALLGLLRVKPKQKEDDQEEIGQDKK
jgi:hypothetical protein